MGVMESECLACGYDFPAEDTTKSEPAIRKPGFVFSKAAGVIVQIASGATALLVLLLVKSAAKYFSIGDFEGGVGSLLFAVVMVGVFIIFLRHNAEA